MYSDHFRALRYFAALIVGFYSFMAEAAVPEITGVAGTMKDGQVVTLTGSNFTAKANVKPLFYWTAEGGTTPSPLGRNASWDGNTFGGNVVDKSLVGAVIAPGSTKAVRYDYETSEGAALSRVHFDSDQLFVWRKRYDDFDRLKDFAIRTRYKSVVNIKNASSISVGMLMSTSDKKLWGKVIKNVVNSDGTGTAYYSNKVGNLTDYNTTHVVPNGSLLYFYDENDTALTTPLLSAALNEGTGIFQTFNHKIFRLWGEYGVYANNTYISLDKDGMAVSEYTQVGSLWMSLWDNKINSATRRWVVEEFQYQAGNVDQVDGALLFWQDRVRAWGPSQKFRFTTATYPHKYSDVYQSQVSNGAQPLSFEYYDSLYIDDSWHRVLVCGEATWSTCKQPEVVIPTAWQDNQLKVNLHLGALKDKSMFYFYVVNGLGEVNEKGYASCPLCPMPPGTAKN